MFDFTQELQAAAETIKPLLPDSPLCAAMVVGSGLGRLIEHGVISSSIDFSRIEGLPVPSVPGHGRMLGVAEFNGRSFLFFGGRAHFYEGHPVQRLGMAVRIADALEVRTLISTCSVGSLNESITPGTLVMVSDHINMTGANPLIGVVPPREEGRFPDTGAVYDEELRRLAMTAAAELNIKAATGVYAWVSGPSFETPAEARMLGMLGADVVGMSLVPESLTAGQLGIRVLVVACVTNSVFENKRGALSHDKVLARAAGITNSLGRLIAAIAPRL
jgi:purine-nucleoside phosphorylase